MAPRLVGTSRLNTNAIASRPVARPITLNRPWLSANTPVSEVATAPAANRKLIGGQEDA